MSNALQFEQPFPGLRPYEMDDAPLFFGRHTHVAEMISLLERQRFLAVVGASGSGKSSLVRAGLLPAIRDGYVAVDCDPDDDIWRIAITRPGDDPYRALAESLVTRVLGDSMDAAILRERTTQCEAILRASQYGLTNALRDLGVPATDHIVVLVDQFEELFRFRRDEATRSRAGIRDESTLCERRNDANAFVNMLLKSCQQDEQFVFVILTMRSDFLGDCDAFIGLPEAISRSQYLTPRLTRSQLEEAIRGPLAQPKFNTTIADDLVTRILNDVGSEPDQLPLMQHALMRTWQHTKEEPRRMGILARLFSASDVAHQQTDESGRNAHPTELSIAAYEHVGGVSGALSQHADEIFNSLGNETSRARLQRLAERLFCSLSERRDGGPLTRRPIKVALAALETGAVESDVESVARAFQAANLLVFSPPGQPLSPETRLDISHESLLRQWEKLTAWIDTETKSAREYRRLMDTVISGNAVLGDIHLDQAKAWLKSARPNVHWAMRYHGADQPADSLFSRCCKLIKSSEEARLERLAKERATAEREQSLLRDKADIETQRARDAEAAAGRFRRRTKVAWGAFLLAVVCLGFAMKYLQDSTTASTKAEQKELAAKKAEGEATTAKVQADKNREEAQEQQASANRQNADHYWRFAILARDGKEPDPIKAAHLFLRGADSLNQIVVEKKTEMDKQSSASDCLAATAVGQFLIRSWVQKSQVDGALFSRDESKVLTWSGNVYDGTARLWDVTRAEVVRTFEHDTGVIGAKFSRDESRVLTWTGDLYSDSQRSEVKLWDVTNSKVVWTVQHDADVKGAQFSHDESRVLTWSGDGTARLWDVTTSEAVQTFKHDDVVNGAQFSCDKSRVLTWSDDDTALLWDVTKSEAVQIFKHDGDVKGAQFSCDESHVLTWSEDYTARLWDVTKSVAVQTFKHDENVNGAQFSRDELHVLTWSEDNTARLWDVMTPKAVQAFKHDEDVKGARFSRDESHLLTWTGSNFSTGGEAKLWDVTTSEVVQTFHHDDDVNGAQFSGDESRVLTWSDDNKTRLWDLTKSDAVQTFKHESYVYGAQFSRDELGLLTWSDDSTVRVWDLTKSDAVQTVQYSVGIMGAQFTREGLFVLTRDPRGWGVLLWDVTKPDSIQTFQHDDTTNGAQFSRDGSRVLTWGGRDFISGEAKLWDVTKPAPVRTFKLDHDDDNAILFGAKFSPDESHVLTWNGGGTARLWDVTTSNAVQTFKHEGHLDGVQFSRDASHVLTWGVEFKVRLWDVKKPDPVQTFEHERAVISASFSRDELHVLTWSEDNTSRLWDVTKPDAVWTVKHDFDVNGALFSGDASRVLTWCDDGMVRLWDVTKPEAVWTFKHAFFVNGAQFNSDESRILTWGGNLETNEGKALLWDLTDLFHDVQPAERILELEVRSGATLDQQLNLRTLKFDEWQTKVKSPEYRAIEQKLAARPAKSALQAETTSNGLAHDSSGSQSMAETNNPPQPARPLDEPRPNKNSSPTFETGPANSTVLWVCLFLLGFVGLNVLVVFASKTRSQSQSNRDV